MNYNHALESALKNVDDSYSDFVQGVMMAVGNDTELANDLIKFIKKNPRASSSEVSIKLNELRGIFPIG